MMQQDDFCINPSITSSKDILTSLPDGTKVSKDDLRMEACGSTDELNSFIGLLITECPVELVDELHLIQRRLFSIGASLVGCSDIDSLPDESAVAALVARINDFKSICGTMKSFILPGGSRAAALAHVCRSVCRRAERVAVALKDYEVVPYLNRLSTYLFYLAIYLNYFYNVRENNL